MRATTVQLIVRVALSLALIYGVYTETGKWTALFALLVCATLELQRLVRDRKGGK